MLTIEPIGGTGHGPCKCCGNMSRMVWGRLADDGAAVAVYYVHWTVGRVDHGANVELVVGPWGPDASPQDRSVVAFVCRIVSGTPQFMVIDAADRPAAKDAALATTALRRDQVIGTPLAAQTYAMLDAIWFSDDRIAELTGSEGGDWPFPQPRNCTTITMKQVLDGSEPILLVTHDLDDHGWQFIGSTDACPADGRVVCLEDMVKLDPSVLELANLPPGWGAVREGPGKPWIRRLEPPDAE